MSGRMFLIDGYALIYRAFFALMTRPLSTSRGENTSAAWGVANFLKRDDIIAKSKQYLAGVPSDVQRRVLEDWHADAMGLYNDPDPGTDVNTRIDDRIMRQLSRAGVSMERLEGELRTRLSQATH